MSRPIAITLLVLLAAGVCPGARAESAEELYTRGVKLLHEEGEAALDRAIAQFEQAVAADPAFVLGHQGLADALVLKYELAGVGDERWLSKAMEHLDAVLEIQPADGKAYFSQAAALFNLGESGRSMRALRKAALCEPGDPDINLAFFARLLDAGDIEGAQFLAEDSAGRFARNADLFRAYADAFLRAGQADAAHQQYEKSVSIMPGSASLRYAQANAWKAQGDFKKAVQGYTKALELDPKLNDARVAMGFCYGRLGDLSRAIAATESYLAAVPGDPAAINNLALFYEKAGRSHDARMAWTQLKNLDTASDTYRRRAAAHLETLE
ncbi:MAG: tetratricopeptide repeat protein [Kiritimatiellae bacterium]|nr:tetratricopeptide repeat protein [Kiritimatiellia bacterium]